MRVQKKSEDYYIIVGLREEWNSYKEIIEATWFSEWKVNYHLSLYNQKK